MTPTVVASQMPQEFNDLLAGRLPDVEILPIPMGPPEQLPASVEILISRPFRKTGADRPQGWPFKLRWIALQTAGIDIYPDWLFDGPVVTSARGAAAVSIAEYVLGAILSDAKRMPEIWIDGPERWTRMQLSLLSGQTLGLVGFGAIGEALAPRALALGMKVLAARRSQRPVALPDVERVATVGELAERSDVLVLAAPATAETHQILNGPVLARAKPGLHVINIARGSLVDDAALLQALDAGKVRLATLDVCSPEPAPAGHPYYSHPKVRLSPHISAFTPDSRINVANGFVDNLKRFRAGAPLNDVVDFKRGY